MTDGRHIVVLGMMSKIPVPGVIWQTVQYLIGLRRLGFEPVYVEAHACAPTTYITEPDQDSSAWAAEFIGDVMHRFDLDRQWAFLALHDDGRCYGLSHRELRRVYDSAELLINLHGGTMPLPELAETGRLVYLETDPVQLQLELHDGLESSFEFLEPHVAFFTFAENYGRPGCGLPVSDRFHFRPTRQPIVVDYWRAPDPGRRFTTVASWRQMRDVQFDGETYTWRKDEQFLKYLALPALTGADFELALSGCPDDEREQLLRSGWAVIDAFGFGTDIDRYRDYVLGSQAEFTVAKDQNVRLRTGWFSDRSATYLAAGKPVITQETGFSDVMATGEGLFGFSSLEEAAAAVEAVCADPVGHARAARELARERFDSRRVLGDLLREVGVEPPRRFGLPPALGLTARSRWPTTLPVATVDAALAPAAGPTSTPGTAAASAGDGQPSTSVVLLACNGLPFTALAIRSVLEWADAGEELIVVDNGSDDGTSEFLAELTAAQPSVHVITNGENRGFAAAVNQGVAAARGSVIVLLNNDTIVSPGWAGRLSRHLNDPDLGLVGAVTNRSADEAEVEVSYGTYGEFLAAARGRARDFSGHRSAVRSLAMFCAAMRREVFDAVGPLDESFGLGLFEDDDYIARIRAAGLAVACAEDVLVHHFGQATLGAICGGDDYGALFRENQRRYESKWNVTWEPPRRRPRASYVHMLEHIGEVVDAAIPKSASVLVVSRGDDQLLERVGAGAAHFPQGADARYAGFHPASSEDAVAHLEALRAEGAEYLLFPGSELWWLDHYRGLRDHLETCCRLAADDATCRVYALVAGDPVPVAVAATTGGDV